MPRPEKSLEDRLGSQIFNFIGVIALLFGAAWALKLAIDHGLLGPAARVIFGLFAGTVLVLWSEHFRRRELPAFSYTLKAVGSSLLYLSLWAAFQLFHLIPAGVAIIAMVLVTGWNAWMAWSQEAELLAFYALIGGLLTPFLLSTGGDHETFLFTYLAALVAGVVLLLRSRPWSRLVIPAFVGTVAYFIGYYVPFFHHLHAGWDSQSTETTLFALFFAELFALASIDRRGRSEPHDDTSRETILPVFLPLANATFIGCALYSIFEDSGLHSWVAWVMVGLAGLFLSLMRLQRSSLAAAVHLAAAVVFLTVAIPFKASGHTLTSAWLVEGLILFWVSTRVKSRTGASARVLTLLSAAGYTLGLASLLMHWASTWLEGPLPVFFSANLASALLAAATLAGAAWLSLPQTGASPRPANLRVLAASLSALELVGLLLTVRELEPFAARAPGSAFAHPDFATAVVGLTLCAVAAWASWRIAHPPAGPQPDPRQTQFFGRIAYADLLLFNLLMVLTLVREISALFTNADAALERALAISAFLMLYGAALLAAGFWRRNAFVRWQALILILFTIVKVFVYDISGLSAGYRVASFLGLGALLLTISFAYQKDWLSLRASPPAPPPQPHGDSA